MEGPKGFRALLANMVLAGWAQIVEDEIRFWNGSKIYLCHCKDPKDVYKYQGSEIHVLIIDELTHFLEDMYRFLRNRVRMVGITLPRQYEGKFPRILCGSNPGNIGHLFVKASFIDGAEPFSIRQMPESEGGMSRQFVPARLADNPSMAQDDPGYASRLAGLGSEALVKAMRDGDWNVVEGAFFDCWSTAQHVLRPFTIPKGWARFRSLDWGFARPFSVGWWAVCQDDTFEDGRLIPRGALIRYNEWYGSNGTPNEGLRLTAEEVALGILDREKGQTIAYGVADPSIGQHTSGPSIQERMAKAGVVFRLGDNTRISQSGAMGGWDQLRARMKGDGEYPGLFVFSTCKDFIRTVPVMQHDRDRPEDLDTDGEDHVADEARYACMSRPYMQTFRDKPRPTKLIYTAQPDGSVKANMGIRDIVEAKRKKRLANA